MQLEPYEPKDLALQIFQDRYAIHKEETFAQACQRVATHISNAEMGEKRDQYCKQFLDILMTNRFSPGGRIWRGSGRPRGQLLNCFCIPAEDSREGWGDALRSTTIISGTGGGVGLNFSKIRPRGTPIRGTGGEATGAVSLMKAINAVCNELREGGGRRSALLFCLNYDHPDLPEFMAVKLDKKELSNANISVCIDKDFLKALDNDEEIILKWQGEERGRIKAKEIWDKIITNAWENGDPGILNFGLANEMNSISYLTSLETTNPSMPSGTLVYTDKGIQKIECLEQKKFNVKTIDHQWVQANCFLSSTNAEIIEIDFGGNRTIKSTPEHRWPIIDQYGRIYKVFAKDLRKNDRVLSHPNRKLELKNRPDLTEEDGFFIGYLLGDGWISLRNNGSQKNKYALGIVFGPDEKYIADRILEYINKRKKSPSTITKRDRCWYIQTTDQHFIEKILVRFGFNHKKTQIPTSVWDSNDNYIRGFIDGLFSADGCVPKRNNVVVLTSAKLNILSGVSKLLSFYGIQGTYRFGQAPASFPNGKSGVYNRGDYRTQYIDEFKNIFPLSHICKQKRLDQMSSRIHSKPINGRSYLLIKSIKKCGAEKVWDISVDHEQHIFPVEYVYTGNCGEVWLSAYDCCCLGAVNLSTHVIDKKIDWDLLEETVALGVRFLDDTIDQNHYPLPIIEETCQKHRRIGLGIMGLHDMLLKMGLKYTSEKAKKVVEEVMTFIKKRSYDTSIELAIEKGTFQTLDREKHVKTGFARRGLTASLKRRIRQHGIRNCALLTIAPTGTTAIVAGTTSGIEPLFEKMYWRSFNVHSKMHDEQKEPVKELIVHPLVKEFIVNNKSIKHFQSAHEISPEDHLAIQEICQRHVDNAISKTINLSHNFSCDQLSSIIRKYIDGLKGITIYRDGSRSRSPLTPATTKDVKKYLQNIKTVSSPTECLSGKCNAE